MNAVTEMKASAARFLADHDQLTEDFASAKLEIDDQRKEIERLDAKLSLQAEMLAQANTDRNLYLQYSFELAAQLQFIVAGSARALLIASNIRTAISTKAANIPPIAGADVAELESILHRIGDNNEAANDGNGMTNTPIADAGGIAPAPPPGKVCVVNPNGTGSLSITPANVETLLSSEGVLVDRTGKPIQSTATRMINEL